MRTDDVRPRQLITLLHSLSRPSSQALANRVHTATTTPASSKYSGLMEGDIKPTRDAAASKGTNVVGGNSRKTAGGSAMGTLAVVAIVGALLAGLYYPSAQSSANVKLPDKLPDQVVVRPIPLPSFTPFSFSSSSSSLCIH